MTNVYVMVGLPGSGKSVCAKNLYEEFICGGRNSVYLSSDEYRESLLGDETDQSNNALVFDTMYSDFREHLKNKVDDIILDMTNTTAKNRKRIFEQIRKVCPDMDGVKVIAYVMATPISVVVKRDKERERTVGEEVIKKFLCSFQFPQKFEGFSEIWIKCFALGDFHEDGNVGGLFIPSSYDFVRSKMSEFDQKNPHHAYTLGKHCKEVAIEWLKKNGNKNDAGYKAALIHDIGKLFTQTIDENGVAHYYNHDSIGAYLIACNLDIIQPCVNWDELFEVLFYVNYHMRAHNDFKHEKAERKYRALFGDERFDRLMMFGECDRLGNGTSNKGDSNG